MRNNEISKKVVATVSLSRSQHWLNIILLFLGFIILGCSLGYVIMLLLERQVALRIPTGINSPAVSVVDSGVPIVMHRSDEAVIIKQQKLAGSKIISLKNPFVIPSLYQRNPAKRNASPKKNLGFLEYQGVVETADDVRGLVRVTASKESYVVYEGEILVELGVEIRKITPKVLTYYKDGVETVISLGGIVH
jgi:hypothetical protein